jgi:CRP-like cAMP-binding protein
VATLENLALRLRERRYVRGEPIVRQGGVGDTFYVIADGHVSVSVDGAVRRHHRPGDGDAPS